MLRRAFGQRARPSVLGEGQASPQTAEPVPWAPRAGLATRLSDFATNRQELCGLEAGPRRGAARMESEESNRRSAIERSRLREFQKDFRRDAPGRVAPRGREPMAGGRVLINEPLRA
jgi:hypothetical protein